MSNEENIMIKTTTTFLLLSVLLFSACSSSTSNNDNEESSKGPSTNSGQTLGSMSGSEDINAYLKKSSWKSVTLDLDKYLYDTKGTSKTYKMQMEFTDGKVTVLADCNYITARYKVRDDELTFSRISSPKPALDAPTCQGYKDADNAVLAFFSADYTVSPRTQNELSLQAIDIETSVTLKR